MDSFEEFDKNIDDYVLQLSSITRWLHRASDIWDMVHTLTGSDMEKSANMLSEPLPGQK